MDRNAFARPVPGLDGIREIDLAALTAHWPELAEAPVAILLLAEMLARGDNAEASITALLKGEEDVAFRPARVLMQDYAGLPALLDIAALRGEVAEAGGDPKRIRLSRPVHLVIDHSVMTKATGPGAEAANLMDEYANNGERFQFLKWAEQAFDGLTIVPPGMGIVHQMNMERFTEPVRIWNGWLIPDSLVGTDSHSTMCGGLGTLGWGVGGVEATAVLLDLPVAIPAPVVVGVRLTGKVNPGVQATDLALVLTRFLRERDVVGQIIEFSGEGLASLSVADRATIANMAPEYGATASLFPFDGETANYLEAQGKAEVAERLRAYLRRQPILTTRRKIRYAREFEFDLSSVHLTIAGPKLPHQTTTPSEIAQSFAKVSEHDGVRDGDIVLAAITSCTITANPRTMITAGLLARKANALGLRVKDSIKASFSPGSRKVSAYLAKLGLLSELEAVGFGIAGYGCMTCVGNSGEIDPAIEGAIRAGGLQVCAVLSGNRNFESRIHPAIERNYLMSPAMVVAYALLGSMREDITTSPISPDGITLADIWPEEEAVQAAMAEAQDSVFEPDAAQRHALALWEKLEGKTGPVFPWPENSSFFCKPEPGFVRPQGQFMPLGMPLLVLGDAITTDHISPVGRIAPDSPAGQRLAEMGLQPEAFGAYGARRGNPEIMRMGTFANPRLDNALVKQQGWFTRYIPTDEILTIDAAASLYRQNNIPTVILAGKNYGIGSARDWAAKGTAALGVRAVIAQSFERIHRTNLALVGVLPLQVESWPEGLADHDVCFPFVADAVQPGRSLSLVLINRKNGERVEIVVRCRLDTDFERACWLAGGMQNLARDRLGA